jgi:four helix bundle protein
MAGVRRFEDLDAWQLSVELRDLVYRMTETGAVLADPRFRAQIRDAAAGPPRNISEGFGRFEPGEFANFTRFAKASLMETQNHLLHGKSVRYFSAGEVAHALRLANRALSATKALHRYLRSCRGRVPWDSRNVEDRGNTRKVSSATNAEEPRNPLEPRNPSEPPEPEEPQESKP